MKKYLTAIILICVIVLLIGASCSKTDGSVDKTNYHTGYQGLVMNFLKNAPPTKMYEDTDFKIAFELKNQGTCDLGPSSVDGCTGFVELEGFDLAIIHNVFGSDYPRQIPNIPGKSTYNPEGGYTIITFPSPDEVAYATLPNDVDAYKPIILATACYKYLTEAAPVVCVDPDPYNIQIDNKVCEIKDVLVTGGQGAPIAVTKVEESMIIPKEGGSKYAQFKIFVQLGSGSSKKTSTQGVGAVGQGIVVHPDAVFNQNVAGCAKPEYYTINKVILTGDSGLSGVPFYKCEPDNYEITLDKNGQGFIICRSLLPSGAENTAFTAPLHLKLFYGYITTVSTSTEIVQVPGG